MTGVSVWRIFKANRVSTAMNGEGAARAGGRWNFPGTPVVYSSSSLALAQLEVLVHLSGISPPATYQFVQLTIPTRCAIREIDLPFLESLLFDWRSHPPHGLLQQMGDEWIRQGQTPVLKVPSAVSPFEFNYLLNPNHSDFAGVVTSAPVNLEWDRRLLQRFSGS
ncbi:MAG: RES family NAD+ phosphorylase [Planctomycetaceae bacterium]|nr:RES family NAD+ phosphorylase [Planctomycetaceae bacterium]